MDNSDCIKDRNKENKELHGNPRDTAVFRGKRASGYKYTRNPQTPVSRGLDNPSNKINNLTELMSVTISTIKLFFLIIQST